MSFCNNSLAAFNKPCLIPIFPYHEMCFKVSGMLKWSMVRKQQSIMACFPDWLSAHTSEHSKVWPELLRIQHPSYLERPRISLRNDPTLERPYTCDRCHRLELYCHLEKNYLNFILHYFSK